MKKLLLALMMLAPVAAMAQKFGHVNTQEIIQAMPEFNTARAEMDQLTQQYENDLRQMQEELQRKAEAFEREEATLPENIKTRRSQELQDLYQRIQQTYQDNQQALSQAQQEKMQGITSKVVEAIKAVGQEGGYVYIMDMGAGIPYISTTLSTDVTAQVKAKLGIQ